MTTHAQADRDLTLSFVLRWLIAAATAGVVLSLLAGWSSGTTHPAAIVSVGQAPVSAATTIALADVAALAIGAA